jgi:cell division protein FtsB
MRRQWLGWNYALLVIGLAILALLVMDFNNRMADLRRLSDQRQVVAAEVTDLVQTRTALETQIAFATSEGAVRQWAYREGRWVQEGDVLVVPVSPGESTPAPQATLTPTPQPQSNWRIWLSLFFDSASAQERPVP